MKQPVNDDVFFSVRHVMDTSWDMPNYHFHQAFEIYLSLSDDIYFFVSDRLYNVRRRDLFIFNPSDLHRSVAPEKMMYERYVIHFNTDIIKEINSSSTDLLECFTNRDENFSHQIRLTDTQSEALLYLFKKAEYYSTYAVYGKEIYIKIALAEILLLVNSFYRNTSGVVPIKNDKDFKKIEPVLQYIQQHLSEELSLSRLSREFFLGRSYLCILFKKATGFGINEYIIQRRILLAGDLLKKGASVLQACESAGFNNLSHFIRTFSKVMHVSPKKYALQSKR